MDEERGGLCGWRFGVRARSEKQVCYCNKAYEEVKRRAVCRSHARLHDSQTRPEHELCGAPPTHPCCQPALWNQFTPFPIIPVASSITCVPVNIVTQKRDQLVKTLFLRLIFFFLHQKLEGEKKGGGGNLAYGQKKKKRFFPDRTFQQMSVNMCNII